MTKKQFDNYKFSAKTRIKYKGKWRKIWCINFWHKSVEIENPYFMFYPPSDIKEIKN